MKNNYRNLIVNTKGDIISLLQNSDSIDMDTDQLEYLIKILDYILLGEVQLDINSISMLMEEIIVTSIFTNTPKLLGVLNNISKLREGLQNDNKISIS